MDFGGALDRWLEAPYVDASKREAEFELWADKHLPELDWEDDAAMDDAWRQFEDAMDDWEAE